MATPHAAFPWTAQLQRLQQRDSALAMPAALPMFAAEDKALTAAGQALELLLLAGEHLLKADADVGLVADELRRFQKFAPPGRPSVQIVQLRRQQSTVQQAQRIARQTFIRNADGFARAIALDVPQKLGVVETVMRWLRANLA
ncbi:MULTISPECIES: hypothetical protein [Stenotrophomonas]|uniref:hypothetical protein n=1 Tax=Stenotrophomonas TaxID=40323 RepID=UPI00076FEA75|nr:MULTISPECIES: hypothetical protein [Stenotrophomonas]AMJ58126.1 hypothetical protein AXG53_16905 [Stenotrophomonas sp. KCTC 12332]